MHNTCNSNIEIIKLFPDFAFLCKNIWNYIYNFGLLADFINGILLNI